MNMTRHAFFLLVLAAVGAANVAPNLRTRSASSIDKDEPIQFIQDGPSLVMNNGTLAMPATQDHRRMQQSRSVLVIRVINNGVSPTVNSGTIQQYIFTDTNSLKNQMMRCSENRIILTESRHGAVRDISVNTAMSATALKNTAAAAAMQSFGDLRTAANHVMFIFPKIPDYFAEAETGYGLSYYNDHFGVSLAVLMHEFGHNLGMYPFHRSFSCTHAFNDRSVPFWCARRRVRRL